MERELVPRLVRRLNEPRRFMHVMVGPRQVGKTTVAQQALQRLAAPCRMVSADEPLLHDTTWLEQQWEISRHQMQPETGGVLAIDEIQKVPNWSETVKRLWDEDSAAKRPLKVLLLGSAQLLVQRGLTESLAGRFELLCAPHWSLPEMHAAFGWDWERFVFFGGYPGAAPLAEDEPRWRHYIREALVETTITRDVLMQSQIHKPALLRRLFELGCSYSGRELSFTKLLGQLQDAGNSTTLAHYLDLFASAGLLAGLQKFANDDARRRGSIPKFQTFNNALVSAIAGRSYSEVRGEPDSWGHLVESAVGAHLVNGAGEHGFQLHYWRDRSDEVDFVLSGQGKVIAIEVKSGRRRTKAPGLAAFRRQFPRARPLLVGSDGISIEQFLSTPVDELVR